MPNWCYTEIDFRGEDAGKFAKYLEDAQIKGLQIAKEANMEIGFDETWLGYYLLGAGVPVKDVEDGTGDVSGFRYRGEVIEFPESCEGDDSFSIRTETAWRPMLEMFDYLIDKSGFSGVSLHYYAEEPNTALYKASDPSMTEGDTYYVDTCMPYGSDLLKTKPPVIQKIVENFGEPGFYSDESLSKALTGVLGAYPIPLADMIEKFEELYRDIDDDDVFISIHEIEFDTPDPLKKTT
ncbi:MAG: hypothetical protein K6G10_01585 [Butyrivibrio sp.]|nr:hypothetical protein [Butyrivibrio sp.]